LREKNKDLYEKLRKEYTENNLKTLSSQIIEAYRSRNRHVLENFANRIMINTGDFKNSINKLFMKVIIFYHPDKHNYIINELDRHYREKNYKELEKYARYIALPGYSIESKIPDPIDFEYKEEYSYDKSDFGYREYDNIHTDSDNFDEIYDDYNTTDHNSGEYGFIEALKTMMYGNQDINILPKDLFYLEGELGLSSLNIEELTGIEYCTNIVSLDLSNNQISNIYPLISLSYLTELDLSNNHVYDITVLAELKSLKTLDISFNDIDDIEPLLLLPYLEYVNLIGNEILIKETLEKLLKRGIIVIH
jgi:Leucine Rich repeats (2 copies)/Leucine Rich repeat